MYQSFSKGFRGVPVWNIAAKMEEKFGFRTMAAPPPLRPEEDKEKVRKFFLIFGFFWGLSPEEEK